ncbi:unnamed protein product [Darwinula stevensoni]|uniref:WAP domain-containing protein n=1 Tax=Darwinula stevensoni TaxID=69355 RepID=A0A7R8XFC1_9CRUS|nr:unnamed protein product [Darwinula stevensoni]CAG0888669.1 unnamed protein product [Darwinula stevensoni]
MRAAGTCPAKNNQRCPRSAPKVCTSDTECTQGQVCCQGCDANKVCMRAEIPEMRHLYIFQTKMNAQNPTISIAQSDELQRHDLRQRPDLRDGPAQLRPSQRLLLPQANLPPCRCQYVQWRTMRNGTRVRAARGEELHRPAV